MCSSSTSKANMYSSTSKANMYSTNLPLSTSCSTPTASIILHRSSVKARRLSSNNNNSSNNRSIRETTTCTPITRGTTTWRSLATKWKGTTRLATEVTMTSVGSSTTTTTSTINTTIGEVATSSMIGGMIVDMISRS